MTGGRYQNKHCAAYKLTRDNDGAAFVYTSNVQLISKVYLQKTSQRPARRLHPQQEGQEDAAGGDEAHGRA